MRVICVDNEQASLKQTLEICERLPFVQEARGFLLGLDALSLAERHPVDIAILEINLPDLDGIALAARLRELQPDSAVIFLTESRSSAFDAMSVHPSGYVLKKNRAEGLPEEILWARRNLRQRPANRPKAQVRTFGSFMLSVDGRPVHFRRSRAGELMAYLVDRQGSWVTRANVFAILFKDIPYDRPRQQYLDTIIRSLRTTLNEYGIGDVLQMNRTGLRICPEKLDCDLYRYFAGDSDAIRAYQGTYMSGYSWAIFSTIQAPQP